MITKYNMTSGELTCQTSQKAKIEVAPKPHEFADLVASLQQIEIEIQPKTKAIPVDMALVSIDRFLRQQS